MGIVRRSSLIISALIFICSLCALLAGEAYAANGLRMIGFSARDSGMGGATTASSKDTSCLVKNPAGLVKIGNRIDAEYQNIIPHDVTMRTEGQTYNLLVPLSHVGRKQKSTVNYLAGGDAGISYTINGTDEHPVAVGCGIFNMAGIALSYPSSRINGALISNGVYDREVDLRSMRIAPGLAVGLTDNLSFGATANIAIQGLRTDLATSSLAETAGSDKWDFAPGGGFSLGLLYKFNEMLNAGACYESHTWMGHHYKYKDVLPYIDQPQVTSVGIAFKPIKDLELTYDTRYISWTDVKYAMLSPADGGFGWHDQWVFAVGGEYTYKDKLQLRLGYNYGRSPIQNDVIFANALLPLIMEHHLTMGFSYFLTKNLSLDFVWEHHFFAAKADNGAGDVYSINGAGTKITSAAEIIGVGLGYKF